MIIHTIHHVLLNECGESGDIAFHLEFFAVVLRQEEA